MFNAKLQEVHQITRRTTGKPDLVLSAGGMAIVQPRACSMLVPPEIQSDRRTRAPGHTFKIVGLAFERRKRRD